MIEVIEMQIFFGRMILEISCCDTDTGDSLLIENIAVHTAASAVDLRFDSHLFQGFRDDLNHLGILQDEERQEGKNQQTPGFHQ